ncbi:MULTISPECIES: hypothetical protein [Komagataeibacter]|nr:hypothetical protein [Komagataeibacter saccharivorans]QBL94214.1 hypothetical protein KSAC_20090 [Komagataeibacter saccharivorans]
MHTLTLVLATAAIVAGMATADDTTRYRPVRTGQTCALTCLLYSGPQ